MKKSELIKDMELFLQEGDLNRVIGLLDRFYDDTKNKTILNLMNDKYITGQMATLANKNNCIQLELNFDMDNSPYTYYEHTFKGDNGNVEIHTIKQLTKESIRNTIDELKLLK